MTIDPSSPSAHSTPKTTKNDTGNRLSQLYRALKQFLSPKPPKDKTQILVEHFVADMEQRAKDIAAMNARDEQMKLIIDISNLRTDLLDKLMKGFNIASNTASIEARKGADTAPSAKNNKEQDNAEPNSLDIYRFLKQALSPADLKKLETKVGITMDMLIQSREHADQTIAAMDTSDAHARYTIACHKANMAANDKNLRALINKAIITGELPIAGNSVAAFDKKLIEFKATCTHGPRPIESAKTAPRKCFFASRR